MNPDRAMRLLAWLARLLSWPFARFDIDGGHVLNDEFDEAIIAVDHRSMFDVAAGLIVFARYGRAPRLLVEQKYVNSTWTRPIAQAIGAIPVDRSKGRSGALDAAVACLRDGETVLLLPEGRLHFDPDEPLSTGPASTGVARLAARSGAPVVAAGMLGTERVWPPGRHWPSLNPFRPRPVVTVRIADAPVRFVSEDRHANTEQVMAEVREQMARCQRAVETREAISR